MDRTLITHQSTSTLKKPLARAHQTPKVLPIKIKLENIDPDNVKKAIQQSEEVEISITDPVIISSKLVMDTPVHNNTGSRNWSSCLQILVET